MINHESRICAVFATRSNSFCFLVVLCFSFFQVMFEGEHSGISPHGDISIDDVSFTPECRPAPHGTVI